MYYEKDITGDKKEYIKKKALEWMEENYLQWRDDIKYIDNAYCFVAFDGSYSNAYSHDQFCSDYSCYMVMVTRIGQYNRYKSIILIKLTNELRKQIIKQQHAT